ncbi:hypothetical protein J2Y55_001105 [Bosea sp. BE125]|nr:hypothetical protein [Bosea sp. BE125]
MLEQHDPGGNRGGDPRAVIPIQREASWRIG